MDTTLHYKTEFVRLRDNLESFVFRFVCNRQDMEDIVQETYVKVFQNINTFQNRSSFKTWVFTIAANTAKNYLKKHKLWKENFQDKAEALHLESDEIMGLLKNVYYTSPDIQFEICEHISYCFNCIIKTLKLSQQICLLLKEIYGFKIKEIMEITLFSEGKVKHNLSYAKKNMALIFDQRCALINKKGICNQCNSLMDALHPEQAKDKKTAPDLFFTKSCKNDPVGLLNIRMEMIKLIHPLNSPNSHLNTYLIEHLPEWANMKN